MKKFMFLLSLLLVAAVSCGDGKSEKTGDTTSPETSENDPENTVQDDSDPSDTQPGEQADTADTSDAADTSDTTDTTDTTDTSDTADTADSGETPAEAGDRYCVFKCQTVEDCLPSGYNAITDADNYKCEDNKCVYLGCISDAECDEIYGAVTSATGRVYRCNKNGSYGYPDCTPVCSTAEDCNLYGEGSTQYAYDLDNNKCEDGFCVYTGCNNDAECETTMSSSDYKCIEQDYSGKTLKNCTLPCSTAADCANNVYPAEYYECKNSQCIAKNCESDEWCAEYMTEDYVCR